MYIKRINLSYQTFYNQKIKDNEKIRLYNHFVDGVNLI